MDAEIAQLAQLLHRLFDPATPDAQRSEMDALLREFRARPDAHRIALMYADASKDAMVQWFCAGVVEEVVLRRWAHLSAEDQAAVIAAVQGSLLRRASTLDRSTSTKWAKVVVDVGKVTWPSQDPHFCTNVRQMLSSADDCTLGLTLLSLMAEEYVSPRDSLPAHRRRELRQLLSAEVPLILAAVTKVLQELRPGNRQPSRLVAGRPATAGPALSALALSTLLRYFQWIPMSEVITAELIDVLFVYVTEHAAVEQRTEALSCLIEILGKNCVPKEFEEFLLAVFQRIFDVLVQVTANPAALATIDDDYMRKLTSCISLFFSNHLRRIGFSPNFPLGNLFPLIHVYTFHQPTCRGFLDCLEIWALFLDFVLEQNKENVPAAVAVPYSEHIYTAFVSVVQQILRVQTPGQPLYFALLANCDELDELEVRDLDEATERMTDACMQIMVYVGELLPDRVLTELSRAARDYSAEFFGSCQQAVLGAEGLAQLEVTSVRLCTLLQGLERMSDLFLREFQRLFNVTTAVVTLILDVATMCGAGLASPHARFVAIVYERALRSLRGFGLWIAQLHRQFAAPETTELGAGNASIKSISALLSTVVAVLHPALSPAVPVQLALAAARLLSFLTAAVRSPLTSDVPEIAWVWDHIDTLAPPLDFAVQSELYLAMTNMCCLAWSTELYSTPVNWEDNNEKIVQCLGGVVDPFVALVARAGGGTVGAAAVARDPEQHRLVLRTIRILQHVASGVSGEPLKSKRVLYHGIERALPACLQSVRIFVEHADVFEALLDLALQLLDSLRRQLGVAFVEQMIQTFLGLMAADRMAVALQSSDRSTSMAAVKLMQLATFLAQEPGGEFASFVPSFLTLVLDTVVPNLSPENPMAQELRLEMFSFLFNTLLSHGRRYLQSTSPAGGQADLVQRILAIMGNALDDTDLEVFKRNIEFLELINTKQKLFSRDVFVQNGFVDRYLQTLFQVLVQRSHNLYREEIIHLIYNLAAVNFDAFFARFLVVLLQSASELSDDQKAQLHRSFTRARDIPTFAANVSAFADDIAFFLAMNRGQ